MTKEEIREAIDRLTKVVKSVNVLIGIYGAEKTLSEVQKDATDMIVKLNKFI